MEGWISLHRKFLRWEWYDASDIVHLFIHLLIKANYEDKDWKGKTIKRSQLFTSLNTLSFELNKSVKKIRNDLKKLEKTGEIILQGASNGTMITVCNYDTYQVRQDNEGQAKGKQRASKGQADSAKKGKQKGKPDISKDKSVSGIIKDDGASKRASKGQASETGNVQKRTTTNNTNKVISNNYIEKEEKEIIDEDGKEETFKFKKPKWDAVEDITRSVEEKHLTEPQRKERIKNIRVEFTTPGMNFDSIMRAINLSENDTIEILNSFVDHIASTGEYCNPLKQLKIHCTNWIKKQINDKEKSNSKKSWSENVGTLGQGIIDEDEHNLSANQRGPAQGCDTTVP